MKKKVNKTALKPRKMPAQDRSAETVAVLVEAAARILEERGFEGFTTNAVAERAGVSIGSLYQYFRNKDSLLASLMERQARPFMAELDEIPSDLPFVPALRCVIDAAVRHQMRRPVLAKLIDFAERQSPFETQAKTSVDRVHELIVEILDRSGAPAVADKSLAALDLLTVIRALTDASGERNERDQVQLTHRIYRAVSGYLALDRPLTEH